MPQNVPIHGQITFFGSVVGSTALGAQPVGTAGIVIQLPNTVAHQGDVLEAITINGNTVVLGWGTGGGGGGGPFSAGNFLPLFTTTVTNPTTTPNLAFNATLHAAGTFYAGPVSGIPAAAAFRAILASDVPVLPYVSAASAPANFVLATPNGTAGVPVPRALVAADIPNIVEGQVINLASDLTTLTTGLSNKAPINSAALTGVPTAPTASPLTNNTQIATTGYADSAVVVEKTRALAAEAALAAIEAATLTGTPRVPTAAPLTNSTQIASTAYTDSAVLIEKSRALLAESHLAPDDSPSLTGVPIAPTATPGTSNAQLATTAYVDSAVAFFGASAVTSVAGRHGAVVLGESDISGLLASLAALQPLAQRGQPNGYASLDGSGFVPTSQLPPSILGGLSFQGTWDAFTNTPTLTSSVGVDGQFYIVTVAGTTNLNGISSWAIGDWALFAGGVWTQVQSANTVTSVNGQIGAVSLATADIVGLTAALALKATLASPIFSGIPTAPTAAPLTSSTQIATTEYADAAVTIETTRATTAEALLASLNSPTLTGIPAGPTAAPGTNTTQLATTAFTTAAVLVETLRAQGIEATLASLVSPGFSGNPTVPTQPPLTNNIQIANTAYVDAAVFVETARAEAAEALKAPSASPTFTGLTSLANAAISGTLADSLSSVGTSGQVLSSTGTGVLWLTLPSSSFSSLTSGTNTTAAMVVGTNASLTFSGTGTINATGLQAVAINASAPTIGQVLTATSPTTAVWQALPAGGSVTSIATAGIATGGPITTTGTITVLGSGTSTTAATATLNLAGAPAGDIVTTDGAGNVQDSGVLLSGLAALASPTFTGTVVIASATITSTATIATAAVTSFTGNPNFTGLPTLSTSPLTSDNSTKIATTAYVQAQGYVTAATSPVTSVFGRTGAVVATSGDYSVAQITGAAPLASPTFTGVPAAPTAAALTNTTQLATTAFVRTAVTANGATLWNKLGNATGALTLANSTFGTTFNQTTPATWLWANTTAATLGFPARGIGVPNVINGTSVSGSIGINIGDTVVVSSRASTSSVAGGVTDNGTGGSNTYVQVGSVVTQGSINNTLWVCLAAVHPATIITSHFATVDMIAATFTGVASVGAHSTSNTFNHGPGLNVTTTGARSLVVDTLTFDSINGGSFSQQSNPSFTEIYSAGGSFEEDFFTITNTGIGNIVTFNGQLDSNADWVLQGVELVANAADAVSQNSPILSIAGGWFDGITARSDTWTIQDVLSSVNNPTSTLVIAHDNITGSPGVSSIQGPIFNATTGFQIAGTATSGNVLRGDGTNFVSAQLNFTDLTGSVKWNQIGNAAGALVLANGTNATTFNQTSAAAWTWANTTVASAITTNASPTHVFTANYWNGAASAADTWTVGSSLVAGTNGASTLSFVHAGSSGNKAVLVPMLQFLASDTGLSRIGAATLGIGNGTQGDISGGLQLGPLQQINNTAASNITTNNSPVHTFQANYWTGGGSGQDFWQVSSALAAGVNAPSSLNFVHSGSPGAARVVFPNGASASPSIAFASSLTTGIFSGANTMGFVTGGTNTFVLGTSIVRANSTVILGFSSGDPAASATDTAIFRSAAGVLGICGVSATTPCNVTTPSANGAAMTIGQNSELLTLSTVGLTTDTVGNLLPAGAIIDSVVCRVTTTITTSTNWAVGDANVSNRFSNPLATLVAGTTTIGLNQMAGSVTTDNAGPTQPAAAKVRITVTGANPGAGVVRITVFYRQFTAPTS